MAISNQVAETLSYGGSDKLTTIVGDKQILQILAHMRKTAARRVMTAGSIKAAQKLASISKQNIPSRYKEARKSIGSRRLKVREANGGGAKAGALVGAGSKARGAFYRSKGVGMQPQWAILGTGTEYIGFGKGTGQERRTGKKGGPIRRTGSTRPETSSLGDEAIRNRGVLIQLWKQGAQKQLLIELRKGKAFNK